MLVLLHAPELLRILMTASSATARFLSLAVLVLSLAPLASLYVIFFSMLGVDPTSLILVERNGQWQSSVEAAAHAAGLVTGQEGGGEQQPTPNAGIDWAQLAKNRTALEELWKTIYQEASKHHTQLPVLQALRELSPSEFGPATVAFQQHWSIVIPWMLTFILGVVVPMILSLWSFWRQYRRGRRGSGGGKRRRKEMVKRLEGYTKHLVPQDCYKKGNKQHEYHPQSEQPEPKSIISFDDSTLATTVYETTETLHDTVDESSLLPTPETEATRQWLLPLPGKARVSPTQPRRPVPGTCVVCLNTYELAEKITWSSNPSCVHCFHTDCIAKWLTRQLECPCCRREFLYDKK